MINRNIAAASLFRLLFSVLLGTLTGMAHADAPADHHPYRLRIAPDGLALDRVAGGQTDPLLNSIRYEADSAQGLAFRTTGIREQKPVPTGTQVDFALDGPLAGQASVTALVTPQPGGVRLKWTVRYTGPVVKMDGGRTGFQMEYAQPVVGADERPTIRFVRPTGDKPYDVKDDTPYRDLEWQLREVTFAKSRLVVATGWYDPDWIYGRQLARAPNLPAPFPEGTPAEGKYDVSLIPESATSPGLASPNGAAADVAAMAAGRPLSLTVLCPRVGNLFVPGETPRFTLRVRNVADTAQSGLLTWNVWDYYGSRVAGGTERVSLAPGAARPIPVAIAHARRGMLFLDATLTAGGTEWLDRTTFAVLPDAPPIAPKPDSPFGLAGIICNPDAYPDQKTPDEVLAAAHRIGARWVRWGGALASAQDNAAQEANKVRQWQALFVKYGLSCHLQVHTGLPAPGQSPEEFSAQIKSTLQRYAGLSSDIEFGNEMNLAGVTPQDYVEHLLRPVHDATREVLPQSKILSMGLGGVDKKWLDGLVAAGGLSLVDALSVHPGDQPRAPEYWKGYRGWVFRPQVLDALQAAGGKDVWLSETYAPTPPERSQLDVRTAADYLVRTYLVSLALGVKRVEWYQLQDGVWFAQRPNPADTEYNYGLLYTDLTPKPGYVAYGVLTEQLEGGQYRGRLALGADGLYGLRFGRGAGRVDVLWSYQETHETDLDWWPPEQFRDKHRLPGEPWVGRWHHPVTVKLPAAAPVTVTDVMGNSRVVRPQAGFVFLALTGSPVYVQGLGEVPSRTNLW